MRYLAARWSSFSADCLPAEAMTFRGFIIRLVYLALFTWVVGAIIESFWVALIWALTPLWFYEVLRSRKWPDSK